MNPNPFPSLVQRFFAEYLRAQRNLSPHTIRSYRDSFRLLLQFLSSFHHRPIDEITLDSLSSEAILAFLAHLESTRGNSVQTRNARLAPIRAFARYAAAQATPELLVSAQRILSIPSKKAERRQLGFMSREEVAAVIAATEKTWSGQRDHLLFTFLYNTGARVSEALGIHPSDIRERSVTLHGKGRKQRSVPLWPATLKELQRWCQANSVKHDQLVFTNRTGGRLTREGVAFRLTHCVRRAARDCPSLGQRRITPHTFRHTTAMHLLQARIPLEVIALWLGHEQPATTHLYVEADLKMKRDCLKLLEPPASMARPRRKPQSHLVAFLEAL